MFDRFSFIDSRSKSLWFRYDKGHTERFAALKRDNPKLKHTGWHPSLVSTSLGLSRSAYMTLIFLVGVAFWGMFSNAFAAEDSYALDGGFDSELVTVEVEVFVFTGRTGQELSRCLDSAHGIRLAY